MVSKNMILSVIITVFLILGATAAPCRAAMAVRESVYGKLEFSSSSFTASEGNGVVGITVTRSGGSEGLVTVDYATANGTAEEGTDYNGASGKLTFGSGEKNKSFYIEIKDDTVNENSETVKLTLTNPMGGVILGSTYNSTLTINDNDYSSDYGSFQFSAHTYSADEDDNRALITVERVGGSHGRAAVRYSTDGGTAGEGSDYTGASGTLTFEDGVAARTFHVNIRDDNYRENSETVKIRLYSPTGGATLGSRSTATLTIYDDEDNDYDYDQELEFSASSYSVDEEDGRIAVTVRRTGGSNGTASVQYYTREGTAKEGSDYYKASGTLTFYSGVNTRTFNVSIKNDSLSEDSETVRLYLKNPSGGAGLGDRDTATLTIHDDEDNDYDYDQELEFSSSSYSVDEEDGRIAVTVRRTGGSNGTASVQYYTREGTAKEGSDYYKASGTLTFYSGMNTRTFNVSIKNDSLSEDSETVRLYLKNTSGRADLGNRDEAVLTIKDDDDYSRTWLYLRDISGHWAEDYIRALAGDGAVSGYPDGTFRPDSTITRAEFTTLLVSIFRLGDRGGKVFGDTSGHWAREAVAAAYARGLVSGYSSTRFGPDDPVTREQIAVMTAKAAGIKAWSGRMPFRDAAAFSEWSGGYVASLVEKGIIKGYSDHTFRPKGYATRAESIALVMNAIK